MSLGGRNADRPPVVVLSFAGTGLATVRCLARGGMEIHAALFPSTGSGMETGRSRHCNSIALDFPPEDEQALLRWLIAFSRSLRRRPVVLPTSDATALFLARHRPALAGLMTTSETSHDQLHEIVSKDRLYRAARSVGILVPPMLVAPTAAEVEGWCADNPPPYLAKPFYSAVGDCAMRRKNQVFHSKEELVRYARATSLRNILVQRMIDSGDGRVYDVYGLCDRRGEVVTLASHRRLRQYPPGTGATSYGEIPVRGNAELERRAFGHTRTLLSRLRYHGIFGIEWLHERGTGKLYLTDFNARPFSSIGHLAASGLNLPLLAYEELIGEAPRVELYPALGPRRWMDFNCDVRSFRASRQGRSWAGFAASVLRCDGFAYFDLRDPGPWLSRSFELLSALASLVARRLPVDERRRRGTTTCG